MQAHAYHGISIHAPLAGRDELELMFHIPNEGFQSTRPLRGATNTFVYRKGETVISIHAPLAGRDRR